MSDTYLETAQQQTIYRTWAARATHIFTDQHMPLHSIDRLFKIILVIAGVSMLFLLAGIFLTLAFDSLPAIKSVGISFYSGQKWDPVFHEYGALIFLIGTIITSFLALALSVPFSLSIALFLGEYFKDGMLSTILKSSIELLAGIPSVIYGMWALFVLVPLIRSIEIKLGVIPYGVGIITASLVLALMIIPYAASIGSDVISLVPADIKEAALSLGATRYEMIKKVVLPYALSGLSAGTLLSLGRAIGETMAVTMVIGNSNLLPKSIFSPANTMASIIANEFAEATNTLHVACLIQIGLLLLLVTLGINSIGRYIIAKMSVQH